MLEPDHGRLLLVFLSARSTVIYKYGASDERAWHLHPKNILDWEAIRRFADEGSDHADAGLRTFRISLGVVVTELVHACCPGTLGPATPARDTRTPGSSSQRPRPCAARSARGLYCFAA